MKNLNFLFWPFCLCLAEVAFAGEPALRAGQMNGQNTSTTTVNLPDQNISVYMGTISYGSETALYVYCPATIDPSNDGVKSYGDADYPAHIYEFIYNHLPAAYSAIMPEAGYQSTRMNGFLVYAAGDDFETLDGEEGAQAIADLGVNWTDIADAAAFFFPGKIAAAPPQSNTATKVWSTSTSETSVTYIYVDGVLTAISTVTTTNLKANTTFIDRKLTVSDASATGNVPQATTLNAWVENGVLHVSGLVAGVTWGVYNVAGMQIYSGVAETRTVETGRALSLQNTMSLPAHGVYIVKQGNNAVKIVY